MARIESLAEPFAHAGLDTIVQLYRDKLPVKYKEYVDEVSTKQGYFRIAQEGDFPAATVMNQGTGVSFEDYRTGPYKDVVGIKRGIGFSCAREVVESDVYGVVRKKAPKMARSMVRTIEADMANNLNLATGTQVTPPDGVALAGTHTYDGGTFSNIVTGNPALSISSLEQAVEELSRQPSQTGDYMMYAGPYTLMVPPALWFLADRLVGTKKFPTTNNNDDNVVGPYISKVVVNQFFTSPTAWAICLSGDDNPLKMLNRRAFDTQEEFDKVKDVYLAICTQIWARMLFDWRGFIYSSGM